MKIATQIIKEVAKKTDKAILFHSASGKDSIALLDLMHPHFSKIVCVFMYLVKDLEHINRYIYYAQKKYSNIEFIQVPHYGVYSYIKTGYMGCAKNEKQRKFTLAQIASRIAEIYNIEWSFYGFKQSDSMNRRLMLRGYTYEAICEKSKKCYPLSKYKNSDVLKYISDNNLIVPEKFGEGQSAGTDISDREYLLFLRRKFPNDLRKIIEVFPNVERILFEYDHETSKRK